MENNYHKLSMAAAALHGSVGAMLQAEEIPAHQRALVSQLFSDLAEVLFPNDPKMKAPGYRSTWSAPKLREFKLVERFAL